MAVVDRIASRLDVARKLGAAQAVTSAEELDRARFNVAVDATGVPAAIESAIGLLDRGGQLLVFGVSPAEATVSVSPFRVYNDELTIVGSMAILRSFAKAVDLLASRAVDPGPLLGEPLPLERFGEAISQVRGPRHQVAHQAVKGKRARAVTGVPAPKKVSREDLAYLHPDATADVPAVRLLDRGPQLILITDGPRPALALLPGQQVSVDVPQVDVVGTIGAGDAFGGAVLAWWTRSELTRCDLHRIGEVRAALLAAAQVAASMGETSG